MTNKTHIINAHNAHEKYHELKIQFREHYWNKYQELLNAYQTQYGMVAPLPARNDIRHDHISPYLSAFDCFNYCSLKSKNELGYRPNLYEMIFNRLRHRLDTGNAETIDYLLRLFPDEIERAKNQQDPEEREGVSNDFWSLCSIEFSITYLAEWQGLKEALFNEIEEDAFDRKPIQKPQLSNANSDVSLKFNSDRYNKIDLIRLGIAFDKLRFLVQEDGRYPTRKKIMQFLSQQFKFEIGDHSSSFSHSKRAIKANPTQLFEQMTKVIEQEYDTTDE